MKDDEIIPELLRHKALKEELDAMFSRMTDIARQERIGNMQSFSNTYQEICRRLDVLRVKSSILRGE